jgi:hypothetical protein
LVKTLGQRVHILNLLPFSMAHENILNSNVNAYCLPHLGWEYERTAFYTISVITTAKMQINDPPILTINGVTLNSTQSIPCPETICPTGLLSDFPCISFPRAMS